MVVPRPADGTLSLVASPLLELRDVSHRFGATVALDRASLTVHAGRVHALLGENGAGKTTLMRIAFGLMSPDSGEVRIDGVPGRLTAPADAIAQGIGMVHQHFTLVPAMSVAENVALGGTGLLRMGDVVASVRALSDDIGLPVDPAARAGTLSVAAQQKVEILKALHRGARVLILDEPTAVLAPAEARELMRWAREYAARGNAVVLITHKLGEALDVADEVTVLRHGRVVASRAARAMSMDALTAAMLGDTTVQLPARAPQRDRLHAGEVVARLDGVAAAAGRERIRDVSVVVHAGEIVGIAGVEGSGHHTLLRVLAGRISPAAGRAMLPERIGFVPEDRLRDALIADESLTVNVALRGAGRRRGRMRWRSWRDRTRAVIARQDLRGVDDSEAGTAVRAGNLSGGNQQKLVLGRELGDDPQLIVAENPARGLDVGASAAVLAQLRDAARSGSAVVIYSADLDELLELADRIVVVFDGGVRETPVEREAAGRAMLGLA